MGRKKRTSKKIQKKIKKNLNLDETSIEQIEEYLNKLSLEEERNTSLLNQFTSLNVWLSESDKEKTIINNFESEKMLVLNEEKDTVIKEEKNFSQMTEEEIFKLFIEQGEDPETEFSSDYSNENFCFFCKKYEVLPVSEIVNFLESHYINNKNNKYLLLVFRLKPDIFINFDIMNNNYLKKYIISYLRLKNYDYSTQNINLDLAIKYQYYNTITNTFNTHIYETHFHQPNLKYTNYVKCDYCKNYMCPKHVYLSNCYFHLCNICKEKTWSICGWCKPIFNEYMACQYIHKS